ncbi:MAG: Stage V sporulation protein D [Planctomycetes bacterium ADurb.Bin126]|mgnify:CR=1 FL=1|nr:MAG: Stage V sporulation protein D [Planctomycetes bacterium ADurb.Bin126]HOD81648.1 penicillin-binding protein 2 [Phycisphaerae bacterium]HQL74779.1 penicillin-binding protein 2 [Phycisphaerae bacterium]
MKPSLPGKWRYDAVFGLLFLCVLALGGRLYVLIRQNIDPARQAAQRQQIMTAPLPAKIGNIYARTYQRYTLLAGSRQKAFCYLDPAMVADDRLADTAIEVARLIGGDPREIQAVFLQRRTARYVPLRQYDLTNEQVDAVRKSRLRSIGIDYDWEREYPSGNLAAAVLGFRLRDGLPGGGLELSQQRHLKAQNGQRTVLADARRRAIYAMVEQSRPPRDGDSVFLTVDANIQRYLEDAIAESLAKYEPHWGAGVVLDVNTGEILAMHSAPSFNPNDFDTARADQRTNRAVTVPFEPGSIFKTIIAAGAVQTGDVSWESKYFCENGLYLPPRGGKVSDHGNRYGVMTVADIIRVSSNIGMAKIGATMGNARLYAILQRFGIGQRTGIDLPGESPGMVRPLRNWDTYSTPRVPFGQEVSTTAIQMTMAYAALSNGGLLLKPRIVDRIVDADGQVVYQGKTQVVRRVLNPAVAAQTVGVMQQVVEDGTGKACRLSRWTSFGKTGTAQIFQNGQLLDGAYTGSFIGGAPASRPRILCLISIYRPVRSKGYYGGTVAAPYVKQVLEKTLAYLDVPPDRAATLVTRDQPGRARTPRD